MQDTEKIKTLANQGLQIIRDESSENLVEAALRLIALGFNVVPLGDNKQPSIKVKSVNALKSRPINAKNAPFFFSDACGIGVFIGDSKHLGVVDIDCKNDPSGTLWPRVISAIKFSIPDVYDKLLIERTVNNGYHLYYTCSQGSAKVELAKRLATPEERAKGWRLMVLIETLGTGQYIVCSPTPGYSLLNGEFSDLQELTPDEKCQLMAICKSFDLARAENRLGMSVKQSKDENTPWKVFNFQNGYQWIVDQLSSISWTVTKEDDEKVFVLRPGSSAKSSGCVWKESKTLYLFSTSTEFEAGKGYSPYDVLCQLRYEGDWKACAKDLAEQGIGKFDYDDGEFYSVDANRKINIKYSVIVDWLKDSGYYKYWTSSNSYEVVQIIEGKVSITNLDKIKHCFGNYIKETVKTNIFDYFLRSIGKLFSKEGLISQLEDIDDKKFVSSTEKVAWLFFKNSALSITGTSATKIPYGQIEGYVWEKNIIQRDFVENDETGDTSEFIDIISGKAPEMLWRFRCVIGYLLHTYKDPANPKVIILNDRSYDENSDAEPQGGTGKGLVIRFLSQFKNVFTVDGKRFNLAKNFALQGLTYETEIMAIEDAAKTLDFEPFFSMITEGITVEKKGKDEFFIPFEKAPKILFTTNYAIRGSSSSHLRRRYELEIAEFFSHKNRPIDHFGRRFFVDWDDAEWLAFDNYMVNCLQTHLRDGLPEEITINLGRKRLLQETNRDFIEWVERRNTANPFTANPETPITKEGLFNEFISSYPDFIKLTQTKFTKWLKRWGIDANIIVDSSNSYNSVMVYRFRNSTKSHEVSYEVLPIEMVQKLVSADKPRVETTPDGWRRLDIESF
ncbi:MAG: DUF5906 domain-containing protein [Ferruginibacter sp.]